MWSQNNMAEVRQEQLGRWQAVLEAQTGINLKQHQHILTKGLKPWLQDMSEAEAEDALKRLEENPWHGLGGWLIDHLAVKETRFYRTPSAYRILARYLQKRLDLAAKNDDKLVLDMWSAGCSTGEEAYTMAMIASNLIEASSQQAYFGVIGSDVSNAAVKVARQGTYHVRRVQELLPSFESAARVVAHRVGQERLVVELVLLGALQMPLSVPVLQVEGPGDELGEPARLRPWVLTGCW